MSFKEIADTSFKNRKKKRIILTEQKITKQ